MEECICDAGWCDTETNSAWKDTLGIKVVITWKEREVDILRGVGNFGWGVCCWYIDLKK